MFGQRSCVIELTHERVSMLCMDMRLPPAVADDSAPPAHRPVRIALVTETYPPEVNGVALTVARMVEGLRRRGHELQLIRPRPTDFVQPQAPTDPAHEVLLRGAPIPCYAHLRMGLPAGRHLRALWRRRRPDLVHIATEGPLGWSALNAARALQLPVTSDFRTNFQAYSQHYRLGWMRGAIEGYLRHFHNRCACTMVPTEALSADLRARGFERTVVVARGVDTQLFDPLRRSASLRQQWGLAGDDLALLYVGRLAAEKNLDLLLQAHAAMREAEPRWRLVLVGDGPLRDSLRLRCPDAVHAGQRSGTDLAAHYASADLFVFPSQTETFGNVTPEAMASGLPVLAFDHAAAGQLIEPGLNGWLAPLGETRAFVALARKLALDAVARQRVGEAARHSALDLAWDGVLRQVESVFIATLVAHQGRRPAAALLARWGPT